MNWIDIIVIGSFSIASLLAIYQSKTEEWNTQQKVGAGLFFFGAIIGLFFDDFLRATSPIHSWAELIGAGIMIIGLAVSWSARPS